MQNPTNLKIDAQRLWDSLMETAEIGKTAKGGIKRLTLTDLDKQVRDWFVEKCREAGCTVSVDAMAADRLWFPPRHAADGRQVRRRAGRSLGA